MESVARILGVLNEIYAFGVASIFLFAAGRVLSNIKTARSEIESVTNRSITSSFAGALILAVLSVLALTRGSPANNGAVYEAFNDFGLLGLLGCGALVIFGACGLTMFHRLSGQDPVEVVCRAPKLLLIMCVLFAVLAALQPVTAAWNVPGWGDAIFWDRISHTIARGDAPSGHDYYLPVYQFGTALLYKVFGHQFFVQQVMNVLLAPFTIFLLAAALRELTGKILPVLGIAMLAASQDYLRYEPQIQQITSWYVPAIALTIYSVARVISRPDQVSFILLGLSAGLAFSIRNQGAFYDVFILLAPLLGRSLTSKAAKIRGCLLAGLVFIVVLTPWTIRNYLVDGRLSPTGAQTGIHMALGLHPDGFHGIRRDLVDPEWRRLIGSNADYMEKDAVQKEYIKQRLMEDTGYFFQGVFWRSIAFWGLLPNGVWAGTGPMETDWQVSGKEWILSNGIKILLLLSVVLSLVSISFLISWPLAIGGALAVSANMMVVFFAGFTEERIHYPVLPILFTIIFVALSSLENKKLNGRGLLDVSVATVASVCGIVIVFSVIYHISIGKNLLYSPIKAQIENNTDATLIQTDLDRYPVLSSKMALGSLRVGEYVRARLALTNHHLPVKWYAREIQGFPLWTLDPSQPTVYRSYFLPKGASGYIWGQSEKVGVVLDGMQAPRQPLEDDIWDLILEIREVEQTGMVFARAISGLPRGRAEANELR
ncbi:ArnT family glycosyltransferase [Thalassospira lucentensis]|uniref:ArnT family glycosyltransferase n=1 Tax=Thalassospira lucentensis TaxID=168935 RepID=UPI003D2F4F38